jgi:hypothetical protein
MAAELFFFFLDSKKPYLPESALCGSRWENKTPAVSSSYKRCTSWLEFETCCANLKPFTITLRPSKTRTRFLLKERRKHEMDEQVIVPCSFLRTFAKSKNIKIKEIMRFIITKTDKNIFIQDFSLTYLHFYL